MKHIPLLSPWVGSSMKGIFIMTQSEMRKQRKIRLEKTATASKKVKADQVIPDQKQVTLEPVSPSSLYYYGLPPDSGFSYGKYTCSGCNTTSITTAGEEMHCPSCGDAYDDKPEEVTPVQVDEINSSVVKTSVCAECNSDLATNSKDGSSYSFCTQCGAGVEEDVNNNEKIEEDLDMVSEVSVEPLMDVSDLDESIEANRIDIQLYNEHAVSPHWNLNIDGCPVAKICLSDQKDPESYRSTFVSQSYGENVIYAIAKPEVGLHEVLHSVKARVYVKEINHSTVAKNALEKASEEYSKKFKKEVATIHSRLMNNIKLTIAGMNKNFFDITNPLKKAFYTKLQKQGVNSPTTVIESAFEEGGDDFFNTVISKAVELMDEEPKVLDAMAKAIGEANIIFLGDEPQNEIEAEDDENEAFASYLGRKSMPVRFGDSQSEFMPVKSSKEILKDQISLKQRTNFHF